MTIETALQSERIPARKASKQHNVPWPYRADTAEQQWAECEVLGYRSKTDRETDDRHGDSESLNEHQWLPTDPDLDDSQGNCSSDSGNDSDRNSCPSIGLHPRRLRCRVHSRHQQQQHHLHPRASAWSRIIQFQLVLVLSLVLVFSGLNTAVNCDENVTVGGESGGAVVAGRDVVNKGLRLGGLVIFDNSSNSDAASGALRVNEIDEILDGARHFTHHWAVHIPDGDQQGLADQVAVEHGFINRGKNCGECLRKQ
uniref:Peptidase S8 pro-domain domain-containing protein n=1 Tax=Anopheles maculatus TaxID=74869 RepID=A0A182T101_9DIPT